MNSPNRSINLINQETEPVILPNINTSLEIERNICRKILFYSCIYELIVIISSFAICIWYSGTSSCHILFTAWIIACGIMWVLNLLIQLLEFKHSSPTRTNHVMLIKLNSAKILINPYNLLVMILGHILVFKGTYCSTVVPELYYLSVFLLAHTYLLILFVSVLFIIMLICLPCFLRIINPLLKKENGLSKQEVSSLEVVPYQNSNLEDGEYNLEDGEYNLEDGEYNGNNNSCVICLDKFTLNDPVIHFSCKHIFHAKCVKEWLLINGSCPICRNVVHINTDVNV